MIRPLAILLAASSVVIAQPVAETPPASTRPTGLNALSDDVVYDELARRGQDALLARLFETNRVPAERQEAIRAVGALDRLAKEAARMRPADRQAAVARVVAGIRPTLDSVDDPQQLARRADALLNAGVLLDVNTLEYWGPSTSVQAQLRPVVETLIAILTRAHALAEAKAIAEAEKANPNDLAPMRKIEALERLAQVARQNLALADYYLALCLDPRDPKRAQAADRAIAFLAANDSPDNPQIGNLKLALGKLHSIKGDYDAARDALDVVAGLPPAPSDAAAEVRQQQRSLIFQGKYFRAVVDVLARNAAAARAGYEALLAWEKSVGLDDDPAVRTANELLEYRILSLASDDESRRRGYALLGTLLDERPELEGQILGRLRDSIGANEDVGTLAPLLLRALMIDAQEQIVRKQQEPTFKPDVAVLKRGLSAAQELASRAGQPDVDARLSTTARFLVGAILEALDRRPEAAAAFTEFVERERSPGDVELARGALANAQRLFAQLGGLTSDAPGVAALYDRIVPLSIAPPFNQAELNYDWAYRLQQQGKVDEAIRAYRAVPKEDGRFAASRYYLMVALSQRLDALPVDAAERTRINAEIQQLADAVRADVAARLPTADEREAATLRQRAARTTILAADLARTQQNDPARAVALLDGIDRKLEGVPDADDLLGEAMFIRVQANMQAGRTDEAVRELVALLDRTGGAQGAQVVFNMLARLEQDFAEAEEADDRPRMAQLQAGRAALTPYLVHWADASDDAEVRASAYRYRVYDAETQRVAATFLDGAARDAKRAEALARYRELDAPDGRKRYDAARAAGARNLGYDPQVALGLARLHFDAGDWPAARDAYARLLADRALGTAVATVTEAGQERQVDNDAYWEATLRFIRATLNQPDADRGPLRTLLREQQIRWGDRAGGGRWRSEFQALVHELFPDTPATRPSP